MNEEQQQQNAEHWQMKIHIKNEQQQHKNLTGGAPKQSNIAESFWLLILKNDYRINYNQKKMFTGLTITNQKKFLYKKFIKKVYHDCLYKSSSDVNELIRPVLNFLFFYDKILHAQKSTKPLTWNKNKKIHTKNI